jgi:TRAP-type C4-dicarboxylate transport system permease small subunit
MTDIQLLILAFILFWLSLIFLIINSNKRLRTLTISFFIHLLYSSLLLCGHFYKSEEGRGLVWWSYLLIALGGHILFNLTFIIIKIFRQVNDNVKLGT